MNAGEISMVADLATAAGTILIFAELFITGISLIIARRRNRREATINFYNEINKETASTIEYVLALYHKQKSPIAITEGSLFYPRIRRYLSLMERFSVGINAHIYDIRTFDRMHGIVTLNMHDALEKYIEAEPNYYYKDFVKVVQRIIKIRSKRTAKKYSGNTEHFSLC